MSTTEANILIRPADHQVLPRDANGHGYARFDVRGAAGVEARVSGPDGLAVDTGARIVDRVDCAEVTIRLPTGGPYDIDIVSADPLDREVLAAARGVLVGDIWILAGQSNMAGGGVPEPGVPPKVPRRTSMISFDGAWKPAVDPLHRVFESRDAVQPWLLTDVDPSRTRDTIEKTFGEIEALGHGAFSGGIGPGSFFCEEMTTIADVPLGLIPCAMGAAPLDMWRKGWRSAHGVEGSLWDTMISRAEAAGQVAGVLWYQGESDTAPDLAATYLDRFAEFVADVRAELSSPDLPFITVQLSHVSTWPDVLETQWAEVREAQRLAATRIPGVEVVAAADLTNQDGLHLDTPGHAKLGSRLARAASGHVAGARTHYTVPNLSSVQIDGDDIVCRISGVNGALHSDGDPTSTFRSNAPITNIKIVGDDVVVSVTGTPTWLGYCLGYADHTTIVDDAGLPVPAFGPIQLTS